MAAICLVAGCGADTTMPSLGPTSARERAEDVVGSFRLVFELPRATWRTVEPIDGVASLEVGGGIGKDIGGSGGGLLGFDFVEANGTRSMTSIWSADCAPYRLEPGRPMKSAIKKSGGFSADEPNAAFYRDFLADPIIRLPAGDWTITAVAIFVEGKECRGTSRSLAAPILVHITP